MAREESRVHNRVTLTLGGLAWLRETEKICIYNGTCLHIDIGHVHLVASEHV